MWFVLIVIAAVFGDSKGHPLDFVQPVPDDKLTSLLQRAEIWEYIPNSRTVLLEDFQDPEVRPGFWEGDIAGLTKQAYENYVRVGLRWDVFPEKRWKNNTVHYHISHLYIPRDRVTIQKAIDTLSLMTCIDFVPYDGKAKDYLLIWPVEKPSGCWSFIGRMGGQQLVSLEPPSGRRPNCLGGPGKAIHEVLHALGIFHEQSRADRDDFVTLNAQNVVKDYLHNFNKVSLENTTYAHEYDYNSIMHYGTHFFTTARDKPTLIPKKPGAKIGQRDGLSRTDCYKVNTLYECFSISPFEKIKYETFCDILGL